MSRRFGATGAGVLIAAATLLAAPVVAQEQPVAEQADKAPAINQDPQDETPVDTGTLIQDEPTQPATDRQPATEPATTAELPIFTPVKVMLNQDLSTQTSHVGDKFTVTVLEDVVENATIVIPKGATGEGEVTFVTARGGFGKPGILAISLRELTLGDRTVSLDGRYREEGKSKNGAVAATWFAVGVFSGFIRGRAGCIGRGRELNAKTGEAIDYVIGQDAILTEAKPLSDDGEINGAAATAEKADEIKAPEPNTLCDFKQITDGED